MVVQIYVYPNHTFWAWMSTSKFSIFNKISMRIDNSDLTQLDGIDAWLHPAKWIRSLITNWLTLVHFRKGLYYKVPVEIQFYTTNFNAANSFINTTGWHLRIADFKDYITNGDSQFILLSISVADISEWAWPLIWLMSLWASHRLQKTIHVRIYLTDRVMVGKTFVVCLVPCIVQRRCLSHSTRNRVTLTVCDEQNSVVVPI